MLRIRLRRTGKKHQPHYRLVVAEHTAPVSGKFVDVVGHYNPRTKELVVKEEQVVTWLDKGAQPSNTVARLLTKQGVKHKLVKVHVYPERPSKKAQEEGGDKQPSVPTQDDGATEASTAEAAGETPQEEKQTDPTSSE